MTGLHDRWLEKAEEDLRFAELGHQEGFYGQVCFLSQHAAEKSLKAFLLYKGELYPKTHKLTDIGLLCAKIENGFTAFSKDFRILDEYFIPVGYPDAAPGNQEDSTPSRKMAAESLGQAHAIFDYVIKAINFSK